MERDDLVNDRVLLNDSDERQRSALNSTVLDYYRKFGRKRDLEQYFSLSTAQSEIRDPSSLFWRRMKEQSDTSDSGEKKSESSNEICRISIKCSIPEEQHPQRGNSSTKTDSESPPIITEMVPGPSHSADESVDDNHSQKSMDGTLDISMSKPLSPTSSVTSQRKLEWDSLADVGYGNETDRKTSASSLSTLEREVLAQKQQYTLDFKQNSELGLPTAHSTPLDPNDSKPKSKKGQGKKTMSFSKKDIDVVEVSVPHSVDNTQAINVNLTKQFSVNIDRDGGFTVDNVRKDVFVSPEKGFEDAEVDSHSKIDKEIQTSLLRSEKKSRKMEELSLKKVPVLICLNTLRRRRKRYRRRTLKCNIKNKRKLKDQKTTQQEKEKIGEQVSEAESFEYMPGHMYNQNKLNENPNVPISSHNAGNKSSLESSLAHTTDSSKESKYSLTKDLEKSIEILKSALKDKYDANLKKKLVKDIIQRLLKSKYGDDDSTPDFLSILSLSSKKTPSTSTSTDADNTAEKAIHTKPKKSILRVNKFNSNDIASTSQSAPNLPSVTNSEKPVLPYLPKPVSSSNTDTDLSAKNSTKDNTSSDNAFARTSSEELYKKYIDALKREEAYKLHLRDKELFLRQKLVRSNNTLTVPPQLELKTSNKLKELIKDLTRNNYDDGSGDASKLEGGSSSNFDINGPRMVRKQRSHSVFTLSSGTSNGITRKSNLRDRDSQDKAGTSHHKECSHHHNQITTYLSNKHTYTKPDVTDSSVQVNLNFDNEQEQNQHIEFEMKNTPEIADDVKYVCLCTEKAGASQSSPEEFLIYKCSRLTGRIPVRNTACNTSSIPCSSNYTSNKSNVMAQTCSPRGIDPITEKYCFKEFISCDDVPLSRKMSKSSQTNVNVILDTLHQPTSTRSTGSSSTAENRGLITQCGLSEKERDSVRRNNGNSSFKVVESQSKIIQESTRCLQTEISIHPKISDPTISDINIIDSKDCVQLISELYRKISRAASENTRQNSTDKDDTMESKSSKGSRNDHVNNNNNPSAVDEKNNKSQLKGDNIPPSCSGCQAAPMKLSDTITDNIVIPIQGTKMTLKLSIAGSEKSKHEPQTGTLTNTKCHGITTEHIDVIEKYTSVTAECSKGVQSGNSNDLSKNTSMCDPKPDEEKSIPPQTSRPVDERSNTYPKVFQFNDRKPLLRSNTDTGNLESRCANKTDAKLIHQEETKTTEIRSVCGSRKQPQSENDSKTQADPSVSDKSKCSSKEQSFSDEKANVAELKSKMYCNMVTNEGTSKDMILDMIQDITKRYSKKDIEKSKKKKCFQEIMTVINYLLDTDDSGDGEQDIAKDSLKSDVSKRSNKNDKETVEHQEGTNSSNKTIEKYKSSQRGTNVNTNITNSDNKTPDPNEQCRSSKNDPYKTTKDSYCGSDKIVTKSVPDDTDTKVKRFTGLTTDSDSAKNEPKGTSTQTSNSESMTHYEQSDHVKYKTDTNKIQRRNDKVQTTHDKGCGRDRSSRSKESSESDDDSYENRIEMSERRKTESPDTCDVGCECGCDESSECKIASKDKIDKVLRKSLQSKQRSTDEFSQSELQDKNENMDKKTFRFRKHSFDEFSRRQKDGNDRVDKKTRSKQQSIEEDAPKTCDKSCGCGESSECKESCGDTVKTDNQSNQKPSKRLVSKCVQSTTRKVKSMCSQNVDSSDIFISTDQPSCSTSSPTARIINKIKKECEKYQKRSKSHGCKKNEPSSSTSNCDHCMRSPPCHCKGHKCRGHRTKTTMEKIKKKCLAYNLILQTSDSIISDENVFDKHCQKLQNIVIKVPKRRQENIPFKEMAEKIERKMSYCSPRYYPKNRSRSWPNESGISSTDDVKMAQAYTVRDYLERNRPDFVERCAHRQNCIRMINATRPEARGCPPMKMIVVHTPNCNGGCSGPTTMYCGGAPVNHDCNNPCVQTVENEVKRVEFEGAKTIDTEYLIVLHTEWPRNHPPESSRRATRTKFDEKETKETSQRSQQREVLSMQLENLPTLTEEEMLYLARELGMGRRRQAQPKIISEREMKKHSEKIYKSLPEVVQKREEAKKESIKKTNLLMANIFKRNLQKKTLRGAVNLSNYSAVIKI